jgi:hypothetical protein
MTNTVIQIKTSVANSSPANNVLSTGELAYSFVSNKLFIGNTTNGAVEIGGFATVNNTNLAFQKANTANDIAVAAFNKANTGGGDEASAAFDKANSANIIADAAFNKANVAGFSNMNVVSTLGSQIWNIPAGVRRWKVTIVGGAGSGGGTHGAAGHVGNGGGSGGVSIAFFNFVEGVTTMAMNVGNGAIITTALNANGTSGLSSNVNYNETWVFANGGTGGANSWFGGNTGAVGFGGVASGGTLNLTGGNGNPGGVAAATTSVVGAGGSVPFLGFNNTLQPIGPTGANGTNGVYFGVGGGGGRNGTGTEQRRGGFGANGVIIIEW